MKCHCRYCDDVISEDDAKEYDGACEECYKETEEGELPLVTDSRLKPSGTGLVYQQRVMKGKTDG